MIVGQTAAMSSSASFSSFEFMFEQISEHQVCLFQFEGHAVLLSTILSATS
ncbi:unnamed protein product [Musa acuminata subsp. burmannicoides]